MNRKRRDNETYEQYRENLRAEQRETDRALEGTYLRGLYAGRGVAEVRDEVLAGPKVSPFQWVVYYLVLVWNWIRGRTNQ